MLVRTHLRFRYSTKVWNQPCPLRTPSLSFLSFFIPVTLKDLSYVSLSHPSDWFVKAWALWPSFPFRIEGLTRVLLVFCTRNSIKALTGRMKSPTEFPGSFRRPSKNSSRFQVAMFQVVFLGLGGISPTPDKGGHFIGKALGIYYHQYMTWL